MGFVFLLMMLIGGLAAGTSTFIWVGHGIYQLIKTDLGFWEILLTNGSYWLIQIVVGVIICIVGLAGKGK